tara:strand:+ start:34 stop:747 length:714 start_codon:yes stop_codon:yes gene_type:complete
MGIGSQSVTPSAGASLTTKGDVLAYDTTVTRLAVGTDGQVLSADSGESTGLKWKADTSVAVTTKGDVQTWDTASQRLAVGANDTVLTADSAEATGLKWAAAAGGKDIQMTTSAITTADFSTSSATMTDVTNGTLTLSGLTSGKTYTIFTWMSYQMQQTVVSTKYATVSINGVEQTKIQNHTSVAKHALENIHGCETGVTGTTTCICKLRVQSDGTGTYQVRQNANSALIISILAIEE